MKKVIPIEEHFEDPVYKRSVLSVVRDPAKMPALIPNAGETKREEKKKTMPEIPAGYIKCKKHDCL